MNSVVYEDEKIVAILHDIVEDTPIGVPDLEKDLELPKRIIDAIVAMTHFVNEPNSDYIQRVKENDLATRVKLADLKRIQHISFLNFFITGMNVRQIWLLS